MLLLEHGSNFKPVNCLAVLTIGILLVLEGLSAFLHALRLHWYVSVALLELQCMSTQWLLELMFPAPGLSSRTSSTRGRDESSNPCHLLSSFLAKKMSKIFDTFYMDSVVVNCVECLLRIMVYCIEMTNLIYVSCVVEINFSAICHPMGK